MLFQDLFGFGFQIGFDQSSTQVPAQTVSKMLLFSKKFLSLLLVVALMFEGERHSVEGLLEKCHQCDGGTTSVCDPDHAGDPAGDDCYSPRHACAMIKEGDKIKKFCEHDASKWSDNGNQTGNPKCEKNVACYCNDADFCNKDKSFGLDGTGGGNDGGSGSVGMLPAILILPWLMATVAVTLVPSISVPTNLFHLNE